MAKTAYLPFPLLKGRMQLHKVENYFKVEKVFLFPVLHLSLRPKALIHVTKTKVCSCILALAS